MADRASRVRMKRGAVVRGRAGIYVGYLLLFFWLVTEGDGRIHLVKLYPFVRVGAILALLEKAIRARKRHQRFFFDRWVHYLCTLRSIPAAAVWRRRRR